MMHACKCLNFVASSSNIEHIAVSDGNGITNKQRILDDLRKFEKNAIFNSESLSFFQQAIGPVSDIAITISQNDLMCSTPVNSTWTINYCVNCCTITHAKNNADAVFLINSNLLTNNEEVAQRKTNKQFSVTFGIIMMDQRNGGNDTASASGYQSDLISAQKTESTPTFHNNFMNNTTRNEAATYDNIRLKNLHTIFRNRLQKEISDTDNRIRRYTEQQFALLKSFREKSEEEYQILIKIISQVPEHLKQLNNAIGSNIEETRATPTSNSTRIVTDVTQPSPSSSLHASVKEQISSFDTPPATPDSTPMSVGNSPIFRHPTNSFIPPSRHIGGNEDCLFELDGLENYPIVSTNDNMSDVEEIEDDSRDSGQGITIVKNNRRRPSLSIAKSLPIPIAFSASSNVQSDDEEEIHADNVDIAASIKALAKSVHGDTVFGDLPRPRLYSQI